MKQKINEIYIKNSKYLPSKTFLTVFGVILIVLGLIFGISFILKKWNIETAINTKNKAEVKVEEQTVLELLKNDTDSDGVFDWEETLWGTNKFKPATFENVPDLTYIENKKKELNIVGSKDDKALTETDKFAREFFSTYTALQGTDQINNETMRNFATSLGQKIVYPDIDDKYTENDIKKARKNETEDKILYYTTVSDLFAKYEAKGIGEELVIISTGLEEYQKTEAPNSFEEILRISQAYKDFAIGVIGTPVPESLAVYHLKIANGAYKTGVSVSNMSKVINDPLIGVSGVSEYEKYSNEFVGAVEDLESFFE